MRKKHNSAIQSTLKNAAVCERTHQWYVFGRAWHVVSDSEKKNDQREKNVCLKAHFLTGLERQKEAHM